MDELDLTPKVAEAVLKEEGEGYSSWLNSELGKTNLGAGRLMLHPRGFALPYYADSSKIRLCHSRYFFKNEVDAKHAGFHLDEVKPKGVINEAVEQIAYVDWIIVNKPDLVGESDISSLVQLDMGCLAHLKWIEYGKVNLDYVLGIGGFDLER
ncbi:hypothetical protein RJT34_16538 [Clitoria ternatea]|uniref:Uncharacterized protein n=1 Tax=Clitoria ternatea TaxID=43366 RepID=A0AAN9J8M7_CLITE